MHLSDLKLMQRIQTQDVDAFDILFVRYQERIARHVQNIVREKSATEETTPVGRSVSSPGSIVSLQTYH